MAIEKMTIDEIAQKIYEERYVAPNPEIAEMLRDGMVRQIVQRTIALREQGTVRKLYQIRVEGPQRSFSSRGHFFSKRVFVSLERAKAFAPGFAERCCGDGLLDLETVTDTKFVEIELDEEES